MSFPSILARLGLRQLGLTERGKRCTPAARGRRLAIESLESRQMLSIAGIVPVGQQPTGALTDKVVYVHGGHGYTSVTGGWGYQRPLLLNMVEDLGNQDQMSIFADELMKAGATVVPLRPVGHQPVERVLDNDDVGVTFSGAWSDGTSSVYYTGDADADAVRFRFATTSATETAVATYAPNLPSAGYYPVYTWAPAGTNRAVNQVYRVNHSGGATEVTVDHSRVGNGLVYLGTYHFLAGSAGNVEISNRSSEVGKVVVADMIRFGNGVGDINRGNGVSGQVRENEAGLYWVEWHVTRSQGIPTSEYRSSSNDETATVSLSPRYAEFMNQQGVGTLSDRVFVSYHSNASTGNPATATARGVVGLHNTSSGGATPNQLDLAEKLGRQVNDDLVAQAGRFEHNWANRTTVTFETTFNYGEINNSVIAGEFDATIVETGFHDNQQDAEMLRDPRVRLAIARATVQGVIDYFDARDTTTPNIDPPPPVTALRATSTAAGSVTLNWTPGVASSWAGGAATGYTIYASTGGRGFDGGTQVAGAATGSITLTGLDPNQQYYFKVVARNNGGESPDSEVVAALASGSSSRVLIVNGFDRIDRGTVAKEPFAGGSSLADRVRPRLSNSFDYAVTMAEAIRAGAAQGGLVAPAIDTSANESVASGVVSLADYDAVFWILGEESTANDTFDANEQSRVTTYLNNGGKLFVSGSEIGWDLDSQNNGRTFYNDSLRADFASDDANTYAAIGAAGSIFAGVNLTFDNGSQVYNVDTPDTIAPLGGSVAAMSYSGGSGGTAGVQFSSGAQRLVMLAFPFETVLDAADRTDVMTRTLEFFGVLTPPPFGDLNDDGVVNAADYSVWRDSLGETVTPGAAGDANYDGIVDQADYTVWQTTYGQSTASASAAASSATADAPTPAAANSIELIDKASADPSAAAILAQPVGRRVAERERVERRSLHPERRLPSPVDRGVIEAHAERTLREGGPTTPPIRGSADAVPSSEGVVGGPLRRWLGGLRSPR
ncbi:MAG: fibronectin type III domain-containing protein [Lacipirellulaceae bacterium]